MKKIAIIVIAVLFIILTATLSGSLSINIGRKSTNTSANANGLVQNTNSSLETKESNEGPVTVTVTALSLENASSTWDFKIVLNTHSEELSEDLVAVSELLDGRGKSYKPTNWEGAPPGGHHREGVLKFNPISPRPESIELKMINIGKVSERRFKWDL